MSSYVITYKNLHDESVVRLKIRDKYEYEVIPVPRRISVTCGIAYEIFNKDDYKSIHDIINNLINKNKIKKDNIHFYINNGIEYVEIE